MNTRQRQTGKDHCRHHVKTGMATSMTVCRQCPSLQRARIRLTLDFLATLKEIWNDGQ
jgi:hypothetical protein